MFRNSGAGFTDHVVLYCFWGLCACRSALHVWVIFYRFTFCMHEMKQKHCKVQTGLQKRQTKNRYSRMSNPRLATAVIPHHRSPRIHAIFCQEKAINSLNNNALQHPGRPDAFLKNPPHRLHNTNYMRQHTCCPTELPSVRQAAQGATHIPKIPQSYKTPTKPEPEKSTTPRRRSSSPPTFTLSLREALSLQPKPN